MFLIMSTLVFYPDAKSVGTNMAYPDCFTERPPYGCRKLQKVAKLMCRFSEDFSAKQQTSLI
jgi:hypothetical protein